METDRGMESGGEKDYPLLVIVGPTASGKSALAIALAQRFHGEVLACDSTQVYRYFDIGTGKVPAAEQSGVPHHLTDLLEPEEEFTAGDYQRRARAVLEEVRAHGRWPMVTAGTGFYLRALLEGLSPLPPRSPELRARLQERAEERGGEYLHRLLARVDPASARAIAPRDVPKLVRALEVYFSAPGGPAGEARLRRGFGGQARRTRTELFAQGRDRLQGFAVTEIGLLPERRALYERIEQRVERMLEAGWLEEVRRLRERKSRGKPFGFLGYRQLAAHLAGQLSLKEAIKQTKHETRQYAKRQITWFRKEPGVKWFTGFGDDSALQGEVVEFLRERIGSSLKRTHTK